MMGSQGVCIIIDTPLYEKNRGKSTNIHLIFMEERPKTRGKRLERLLVLLTLLLAAYTAVRAAGDPAEPLILETGPVPTAGAAALLDLNTATAEELESLPGVGPVIARRILDWRAENGPFTGPQDVMAVSGIGEATYAKLEPYITFG